MTCLKKKMDQLAATISEATRLAAENKCNFVVVTIRHKWMYDKESCWVRDGKVGTLVKLIEYEDNMQ